MLDVCWAFCSFLSYEQKTRYDTPESPRPSVNFAEVFTFICALFTTYWLGTGLMENELTVLAQVVHLAILQAGASWVGCEEELFKLSGSWRR